MTQKPASVFPDDKWGSIAQTDFQIDLKMLSKSCYGIFKILYLAEFSTD